jgi:hypothetical protein
MYLPTLLFATLATALPTTTTTTTTTDYTTSSNPTNSTSSPLTYFYLLTTTSPTRNTNSSLLPSVSATSLFDPLAQTTYLLRLIGPGYNSLPQFNLTADGTLETEAAGPHGVGEFEYNSTRVRAGEDLKFEAKEQPKGNLGLADGFLLTVGGESEGWTICEGDLGQQVVNSFFILFPSSLCPGTFVGNAFFELDADCCGFL